MIKVCAIQMSFSDNYDSNMEKVAYFLHYSAESGCQIALLPELFSSIYFCKKEDDRFFFLANSIENNPTIKHIRSLAKKFKMVIPVSFFEKDGPNYYNSVAVIDYDGLILGVYRKSHIPDGIGYREKYYFRPGNTGFKVWHTKYAKIGLGICWDQWFPEAARILALQGADILLYPTAIGSEHGECRYYTKNLWQRAMIGHSVCNIIPVVSANRVGYEENQYFYGFSFITNHLGSKITEIDDTKEGVIAASFSFSEIEKTRASFGFFRDRRSELYSDILK